jgi:hypothetical protein
MLSHMFCLLSSPIRSPRTVQAQSKVRAIGHSEFQKPFSKWIMFWMNDLTSFIFFFHFQQRALAEDRDEEWKPPYTLTFRCIYIADFAAAASTHLLPILPCHHVRICYKYKHTFRLDRRRISTYRVRVRENTVLNAKSHSIAPEYLFFVPRLRFSLPSASRTPYSLILQWS